MNFEKNKTVEAPKNSMEQVDEKLEPGQEIANSKQMEEALVQEMEMSKNMVKETMADIESMKKTEPGMKEMIPTTESAKRLLENVGYDPEEVAKDKERFANMPDAEMYNQVQILTLEKTRDLIDGFKEGADPKSQKELDMVKFKIGRLLIPIKEAAARGQAVTSYAEMMTEGANKARGMVHDGLSKRYRKAGYESSWLNSGKVYESFQNDILDNVLEPSKQELFKKISKEATKKTGHSATSYLLSGASQRQTISPLVSSVKVEEIINKL